MKKLILLCVLTIISSPNAYCKGGHHSGGGGTTHVRGYTKGNGTYVSPHIRHLSGGSHSNDYNSYDFDSNGYGDYTLPKLNFINQDNEVKNESVEQSVVATKEIDETSLKCFVCRNGHKVSFQDMPCGYYESNKN